MKKYLSIMIMILILISCGKKSPNESSSITNSDALSGKKSFSSENIIDDKNCIDEAIIRELGENDYVKKVIDDSDVSFCDGLRVRIKSFKISNGELRVYGFAQSTSGQSSCLKQGSDFKRFPFLGDQGTLIGDKIKISLGGHEYSPEGKLNKAKGLKAKFVKFDIASYKGEMGFFESNQLKCHAQN